MKVVIQRVLEASVSIDGTVKGAISNGMLVLAGIDESDSEKELEYIVKKTLNLRIFDDENGVMNKSIIDSEGSILLISQFTLLAQTRKGNRPSYIRAARPEKAIPLYTKMISMIEEGLGKKIETGEFGADMKVSLINDGPVTIIIDTNEQ